MHWNKRNWSFSTIAIRPKSFQFFSNLSLKERLQYIKPVHYRWTIVILAVRNVLIRRKSFFCLSASNSVCFIIWNLALFSRQTRVAPGDKPSSNHSLSSSKKPSISFVREVVEIQRRSREGQAIISCVQATSQGDTSIVVHKSLGSVVYKSR